MWININRIKTTSETCPNFLLPSSKTVNARKSTRNHVVSMYFPSFLSLIISIWNYFDSLWNYFIDIFVCPSYPSLLLPFIMSTMLYQPLNLVRMFFFGTSRKICAEVEDFELELNGLTSDDIQFENNPQIVSFEMKTTDNNDPVTVPVEIEPMKIVDIQTIEIVLSNKIPVEIVAKTNQPVFLETDNKPSIVPAEPMKKNDIVLCNAIKAMTIKNSAIVIKNNETLLSVPVEKHHSSKVTNALAFYGMAPSELTKDSVRNVFRKLVFRYHPDRNASTTTDLMQKIYDSKHILLAACNRKIPELHNDNTTAIALPNVPETNDSRANNDFTPIRMQILDRLRSVSILNNSLRLQKTQASSFTAPQAATKRKTDSSYEKRNNRRKFNPPEPLAESKRDLPLDTYYEQPNTKRRKRIAAPTTPPATTTREELDDICKQLDNSFITEPVEQISKSLDNLKISKQATKATKATEEQQSPVPMELHDPMDWEEWTPEDTEMSGESNHLKRGGVYLLFEQPSFKRRRRFENEEMNWQTS